ncbi:hypothetical protein ACM66B_004722 [Microbotryomycetes sp. NB124-2]
MRADPFRVQSNSTYGRQNRNATASTSKSSAAPPRPRQAASTSTTAVVAPSLNSYERALLTALHSMARPIMATPSYNETLQQLKGALFDKDYERAFGGETDDLRMIYSTRWVPARAVIYRRIFQENSRAIMTAIKGKAKQSDDDDDDDPNSSTRVVMVGGGAGSEVVAFTSWIVEKLVNEGLVVPRLDIVPIDTADWTTVLKAQQAQLSELHPQLDSQVKVTFLKDDILNLTTSTDKLINWSSTRLVTILFTISELFLQSRSKTFQLLSHISKQTLQGTLLLIVESASLALIPVGSSGRNYPVGMLLDGVLTLDKGKQSHERAQWECLQSEDAKWYRLPTTEAAQVYPGQQLENTRVVLRLYRKL